MDRIRKDKIKRIDANDGKSYVFAERLKGLRTAKGVKQKTFSENFSKFIGKTPVIPISTVSSWESGQKRPPYEILVQLAQYFEVSVDYLLGKDEAPPKNTTKKQSSLEERIVEIKKNDLMNYSNKPVFVVYGPEQQYGKWCIYNSDEDIFCAADQRFANGNDMTYYALSI